jgi:amino acid carrier protein
METLLGKLERAVWSWPLLLLLLGTGLKLTLQFRGRTLLDLPKAFKLLFRRSGAKGGVTPLGALCTSLSAAIGTGNIIGVATALSLGGPGALLWMELSALTGLALKYAEGYLAVRYRSRDRTGHWRGGPFAYMRLGLGPLGRPLACSFALFGAFAGLCGVGTFVQIGSVSACLSLLTARLGLRLPSLVLAGGRGIPLPAAVLGLVFALLTGATVFGGIQRVSRVSTLLVPLMGGTYLLCCLWILCRNAAALPSAVQAVFRGAFRPGAGAGGLLGAAAAGVSRGVFSHEAGLGTGPIAAASAEGLSPEEQGLLSMTAVVFDTFLICTMTALVLLCTGTAGAGLGAAMEAFAVGLPLPEPVSMGLLTGMLTLFSLTTVLGWSCYGTACLEALTGEREWLKRVYLALYTLTVAIAPWCSARAVWSAANLCNALMAVPNGIALLLLSPKIRFGTKIRIRKKSVS